jgi:hypothetical protein
MHWHHSPLWAIVVVLVVGVVWHIFLWSDAGRNTFSPSGRLVARVSYWILAALFLYLARSF